jgi:hypothetical protein
MRNCSLAKRKQPATFTRQGVTTSLGTTVLSKTSSLPFSGVHLGCWAKLPDMDIDLLKKALAPCVMLRLFLYFTERAEAHDENSEDEAHDESQDGGRGPS